jgi:hypothetical protein
MMRTTQIKEIEAGRLEHRMAGTLPRIPFEALHAYARAMRGRQCASLERQAAHPWRTPVARPERTGAQPQTALAVARPTDQVRQHEAPL